MLPDERLESLIEAIPAVIAMQARQQRTLPSRRWFVTQAVINATEELFPCTVKEDGTAYALRCCTVNGLSVAPRFVDDIRRHFRLLVEREGGTTCPLP